MKTVQKKPGEAATVVDCTLDLASIQAAVGGYFEPVSLLGCELPFDGAFAFLCNEDGRMLKLDPNVYMPGRAITIVGPLLVCGGADAQGELCALSENEAASWVALLDEWGRCPGCGWTLNCGEKTTRCRLRGRCRCGSQL